MLYRVMASWWDMKTHRSRRLTLSWHWTHSGAIRALQVEQRRYCSYWIQNLVGTTWRSL